MTRLAWLTDVHLNFVAPGRVGLRSVERPAPIHPHLASKFLQSLLGQVVVVRPGVLYYLVV